MTIDPVKIPQNVQIEDKVVGPLSLRQIIIMAFGGGFSYAIYATVQRSFGHVSIPLTVIIWIPAVIAAAFAIVNINDLSLLRICFLLLEKTQKPSKRIWGPRTGISITIHTSAKPPPEDPAKVSADLKQQTATEQIAELSSVMDRASAATNLAAPETTTDDVVTQKPASSLTDTELPVTESTPPQKAPVNPERIQVDAAHPAASHAKLSDLSVFRDIFPSSTWSA